jgi:hypothetical protein
MFVALENLDAELDISRAWEPITENIKISANESVDYYELKKHKQWFGQRCSKWFVERKQATLQWLQDRNEINKSVDIRRETSRQFRKKRGNIWKIKLMSLQRTVRTRTLETCIEEETNLWGAANLEVINLVKDENGDPLADSHNILNRWRNYFSQLLNVHRAKSKSKSHCDRQSVSQ